MNKDKTLIKKLVRESLLREKPRHGAPEGEAKNTDTTDKREKSTKKDYSDVVNTLDKSKKPTAPSQVGVMKAMGIADDESGVNRSLFGKKLHQEKNDEGGLYQFNDEELGQIRGILGIS